MAEEESEVELDRLKEELETLLVANACDEHGHISKSYCAKFCKLVEEHTGRWQVPLPQLQVLRWALCSFVRGTASFPADCEHVRYTLSSLALSVFELLLFFGKEEFPEDPLKGILDSFQDCQACLVRHQNVYLLQLRQIMKDGGPWASAVLQGILRGAPQDPDQVSRFLGSEASVFLELRVRYLLVCERVQEAMALARACSQHPSAGRHLFFLQAYLTCLWKAAQHDRLHTQMSVIDGKDAVDIICGCEEEEDDELLLALSRGFLNQQLRTGDMLNLWDLVFVWSKLQLRTNPSTDDFLQQCKELILTATNARAVFPFIKIILAEVGKSGLRLCVEVCAQALESDLQNDLVTKSLLYKTVAFLLPSDLEVCRVCALLVFFLERSVESYKTVSLLYKHPDVEYCADASPVGNHVRFEVLQILKKGLYFDPEFWNFLTLRSTCMNLLRGPLAKAELSEILAEDDEEAAEDETATWAPTCCVRQPCVCHLNQTTPTAVGHALPPVAPAVGQHRKSAVGDGSSLPTRWEVPCGLAAVPRRRGRKPGTKLADGSSSRRRSFRQLDMVQQSLARQLGSSVLSRQQRLASRQAERRGWKRRGRKPRWLLEEEAAPQAENNAPGRGRRPGRKPGRKPQTPPGQMRTYERSPTDRGRNKGAIAMATQMLGLGDGPEATLLHGQSGTLEFSLPDNELPDTWSSLPALHAPRCVPERYANANANAHGPGERVAKAADGASLSRLLQMFSESGTAEPVLTLPNTLAMTRQFHSYAKPHQEQGVQLDAEPEPEPTVSAAAASQPQVVEVVEMEVTTSAPTPLDGADQLRQTHTRLTTELCGSDRICDNSHLDSRHALRVPAGSVVVGEAVMAAQGVPVGGLDKTVAETPPNTRPEAARGEGEWPQEETPASTLHRKPASSELPHTHSHAHAHTHMLTRLSPGPPSTPELQQTPPSAAPASALAASPDHSLAKSLLVPQPQATPPGPSPSVLMNATSHDTPQTEPPKPPAPLQQHTPSQAASATHAPPQTALVTHTPPQTPLAQHTPSEPPPAGIAPAALPSESLSPGVRPAETLGPVVAVAPESPVLVHCCGLCHKVFRGGNIMRHAYSHYRGNQLLSPGKCMFCDEPPADMDEAYDHFSRHVAQLPSVAGEALENGTAQASDHGAPPPSNAGRKKRGRWMKRRPALATAAARPDEGADATPTTSDCQHHPLRPNGKIRREKRRVQEEEPEEGSAQRERRPLRLGAKAGAREGEKGRRGRRRKQAEGPASSEIQGSVTAEVGVASQPAAGEQPITAKPNKLKRKAHKGDKRAPPTPAAVSSQSEQGSVQGASPRPVKLLGESSARVAAEVKELPEQVACPVAACPTRLQGRGAAVLGHLLQEHPSDSAGFRSAFGASEGRCMFCTRRFNAFQHYYDHVRRHSNPSLRHPCPHQGCPEAFRRLGDVRGHVKERHAHSLQLQCCFPGCPHTAQTNMELHRHERGHYAHAHARPAPPNGEVWLTSAPPLPARDQTPAAATDGDLAAPEKTGAVGVKPGWEGESGPGAGESRGLVNGHGGKAAPGSARGGAGPEREGSARGGAGPEREGSAQGGAGPEREGSAQGSSPYGSVAIKPFVRPLPCAYLDEKYTSMPKRRKEMAAAGRQVTATAVTAEVTSAGGSGGSAAQRPRCSRCSASLASTDELQEHLKKCTALFGFDSDEEGGW